MSNIYGQTLLDDMVSSQSLPMPLVKQAAKEILSIIREGLVQDGTVNVSNFGSFRLKPVAARNGFNPQTRERITIAAHHRVIFSPCKALRELIQPVHLPVIPIKPEVIPTRAAAKSATIIPTAAVVSKRIIPPPPPEAEVTADPESTTVAPKRYNEPMAATKIETPQKESAPDVVPVTDPIDEAAVATESESGTSHTESHSEAKSDIISVEMGEKIEQVATRISSKKHYYLGAAAILVIAVVSTSLLRNTTTEIENAPAVKIAATQQVETPAPVVTSIEPQADTAKIEAIDLTEVPPPETETVTEEIDSSTLYTEMDKAITAEEKAIKSNDDSGLIANETNMVQTSPATEESTAPLEPQTAGLFFSEQAHEIVNGESLWRLARKHYKNPLLWPHIYQANAAIIDNPDSLREGRIITLPSLQGSTDKLSKTDRRNIAEGYYLTYLHYKKIGHKDAFFALLEAKRYDNKVVEEHRSLLQLSKVEEIMLGYQETMPF
ncbi:MAG: HU family DNA-binding protein [Pseudomonadota bacterium]